MDAAVWSPTGSKMSCVKLFICEHHCTYFVETERASQAYLLNLILRGVLKVAELAERPNCELSFACTPLHNVPPLERDYGRSAVSLAQRHAICRNVENVLCVLLVALSARASKAKESRSLVFRLIDTE